MVIVLLTALNGITEDIRLVTHLKKPFRSPYLLFFAIVAVIHDQHLFSPVINAVLAMEADLRPPMFFLAVDIVYDQRQCFCSNCVY